MGENICTLVTDRGLTPKTHNELTQFKSKKTHPMKKFKNKKKTSNEKMGKRSK